ncbi:hypothetical protein KKH43_01945 [Patescibacteria group bacterium]|nr:hypothetical protein [Patescibacteria group bacterium]
MSQKKVLLFVGVVLGLCALSLVLIRPSSIFAYGEPEIKAEKLKQATEADPPSVAIEAQPSFYVSPGSEATVFAQINNFGGRGIATDFFYNWCFDDIPVNTFITGSADEFVKKDDDTYAIKNQYGELKGGKGACNIKNIYNFEYIATDVLGMDGSGDARIHNDNYFIAPLVPAVPAQYADVARYILFNKDISVQSKLARNLEGVYSKEELKKLTEAQKDPDLLWEKKARELSTEYANLVISAQNNPKDQKKQEALAQKLAAVENKYGLDQPQNQNLQQYFLQQAARSSQFLKKDIRDSLAFERTVNADDDIDADGMADSWELLYFGKYAGQDKKVQPPAAKKFILFSPYLGFAAGGNWPVKENQKYGKIDIGEKDNAEKMYGNFLRSVSPLEDPDGDGVHVNDVLNNCNYDFKNEYPDKTPGSKWIQLLENESCMISAGKQLSPIVTEGWQLGAPNFKSTAKNNTIEVVSGGGIFANFMEYIAGTDPQNADTDADGIPDGADYIGLKQQAVPVVFNKKAGDNIQVQVHVVGDSTRGSQVRGADAAPNASQNVSKWWIESADDQKSLRVGGGLPIPVRLVYAPYPVTKINKNSGNSSGNPVLVTAGATSTDETTVPLFYQWYLDNVPLPAPESELVGPFEFASAFMVKSKKELGTDMFAPSGTNKKNLEFNIDDGETIWGKLNPGKTLGVCTSRTVGLDLVDDKTGTTTHGDVKIPIGSDVSLTEALITNVDPAGDTVLQAYNLNDPSAINEIRDTSLEAALKDGVDKDNSLDVENAIDNGEFKKNANTTVDPRKGYRVGDVVRVTAKLDDLETDIAKGAGKQCPDDLAEKLVYNWYFDDLIQEEKSGAGMSGIQVAMTSEGSDLRQVDDDSSHYLRLEVINTGTGELFARDIKELRVVRPYVEAKVDGAQLVSTGGDNTNTSESKYKVVPGSEVTVFVSPQYFRPLPGGGAEGLGFEYAWSRNGVIDENATRKIQGSNPSPGSYTFTASATDGDIDEITFEVSTEGEVTGDYDNVLQQSATQTLRFSSAFEFELAEGVEINEEEFISGSISKFIPEHYKNVFNVTFALGGFALLAAIVYMMYKGRPELKK